MFLLQLLLQGSPAGREGAKNKRLSEACQAQQSCGRFNVIVMVADSRCVCSTCNGLSRIVILTLSQCWRAAALVLPRMSKPLFCMILRRTSYGSGLCLFTRFWVFMTISVVIHSKKTCCDSSFRTYRRWRCTSSTPLAALRFHLDLNNS